MPFNMNSIPIDGRTPEQIKQHLDLYNRSQDIILVHNPDEADFQFFYNRRFNPTPYIIPGKNRDIGFGAGNLEIRRYLAEIYLEKKGEQMINAISKADWEEKKLQYRLEERGQMEERLALRTNNTELWKQITPKLWLGMIRQSEESMGTGELIPEKTVDNTLSNAQQALESLGLNDKLLSDAHAAQQEDIAEEEKRKQELINSIV